MASVFISKTGHTNKKQPNDVKCCDEHEILWLQLRPNRLPRGFSCLIAAVIYHPPKADDKLIRDHLFKSLTTVESRYPNCGILLSGDFNRLDINSLLRHFRLKQIMNVPTRQNATIDLVISNLHEYYSPPQAYPPFGLSDHNVVMAAPIHGKRKTNTKQVITKRDTRPSCKAAMGRYLINVDWPSLFLSLESCDEKWGIFQEVVHIGFDLIMPMKQFRIDTADAAWMTKSL